MSEYPIPKDLKLLWREAHYALDEDLLYAGRVKTLIERIAAAEGRVAELEAENKELHDRMDALRIWAVLLDAELPTDFEPSLVTEERIAAFAKKYEDLEAELKIYKPIDGCDIGGTL